ncbi:MAG TPA: hypothetical protein VIC26_12340, partial [Marinagarivorans sp.]
STIAFEATTYHITVDQTPSDSKKVISSFSLDNTAGELIDGQVFIKLDGKSHSVVISMAEM